MSVSQPALFGNVPDDAELPPDGIVAPVRARLHVALAQSIEATSWADHQATPHEDNAFFGNSLPPLPKGAALWAEFEAEMNRPYAVMTEGKEPDLDDAPLYPAP